MENKHIHKSKIIHYEENFINLFPHFRGVFLTY
jgi:hypothetical protein